MALKVPMDPDDLEELRDFVRAQVRGFAELDEIPAMAIEYMDGSAEVSEELARTLVDSEVATLRAEEPTWPRPTDNDRLDAAFSALRAGGILAEQDYWCCQTCGHSAASGEVEENGLRGYVFYHQQDTESAVSGGGIFLAFGTGRPDADADVAIATEAVEALRGQGLEVQWNGTVSQRPYVQLTWQRRRFGQNLG